jgi:hypothetical protein
MILKGTIPAVVVCFSIFCAGAAPQTTPDSQTQHSPPSSQPAPTIQEPVASPNPWAPSQTTPDTQSPPHAPSRRLERKEQSQRMLGVIPDFGTTSRHNASPLSSGQKFHLFAKSAFDPVGFSVVGLQAGLSQAEDEFPEYGQGATGYGKRYGTTLTDEVSSSFGQIIFIQFCSEKTPDTFGWARAQSNTVSSMPFGSNNCRTDKGGRTFAGENVLAAFTTGGLSNAY